MPNLLRLPDKERTTGSKGQRGQKDNGVTH
jgi:hypothetical protein